MLCLGVRNFCRWACARYVESLDVEDSSSGRPRRRTMKTRSSLSFRRRLPFSPSRSFPFVFVLLLCSLYSQRSGQVIIGIGVSRRRDPGRYCETRPCRGRRDSGCYRQTQYREIQYRETRRAEGRRDRGRRRQMVLTKRKRGGAKPLQ